MSSCVSIYHPVNKSLTIEEKLDQATKHEHKMKIIWSNNSIEIFRSITKNANGEYTGISYRLGEEKDIEPSSVQEVMLLNKEMTRGLNGALLSSMLFVVFIGLSSIELCCD